jgi:hypothetical protein
VKKEDPGARLPKRIREELERTAKPSALAEAADALVKAIEEREAGRIPSALRYAAKAKEAAPRSPSVREVLGLLHFAKGSWHSACQELLAYRRLRGDRRRDPVIAACYRESGEPVRALNILADLQPAAVPADTFISAQVERARAYAATGKRDVALEVLKSTRRTATGARARKIDEAIAELT